MGRGEASQQVTLSGIGSKRYGTLRKPFRRVPRERKDRDVRLAKWIYLFWSRAVMPFKTFLRIVLCSVFLLAGCSLLLAQATTSLGGRVTDSSGAAIPNAS